MILYIIFLCCLVCTANSQKRPSARTEPQVTTRKCLTGYMTDIQSWVNADGSLPDCVDNNIAIDLSNEYDAVPLLLQEITSTIRSRKYPVKILSMARCGLREVPMIFHINDSYGRALGQTVEYVTFYGNFFELSSSTGQEYDVLMNATHSRELSVDFLNRRMQTIWSNGFSDISFPRLKELDLRSCAIKVLKSHVFSKMPMLESLYLGENSIALIEAKAFVGLRNLIHLDLSRNFAYDVNELPKSIILETMDLFKDLVNLQSLDLSYTNLGQRNTPVLRSVSPKIQRLSICYCAIGRLREDALGNTSIKFLDVSGNLEVLSHPRSLRGLEETLRVLYAEDIALKTMEPVRNFRNLEILKLADNEISFIPKYVVETLVSLQVLDLDKNRVITWFGRYFANMPKLRLLSLRDNNINMISEEMGRDISNISYVGISKNFIICNCNARDIYELAWRNEMFTHDQLIMPINNISMDNRLSFHRGFSHYNELIKNRKPLSRVCDGKNICDATLEIAFYGKILFFDYTPSDYQCLLATEGQSTGFGNYPACSQRPRENQNEDMVEDTWNRLYLIIIPVMILPSLTLLFVMRRNLRYFFITMRNSAMLSLINKNDNPDDTPIFNYDVFVSYCNEDRAWVLDQLLPHVERDCNISVCLHERDFQVGLSILENIVSCMDRSRSIMLILSQRFLLSQWCQFEMHLAQHRLLETRREDLILILLEEIPRRLRPNTLHYLMLTKTYIVWPKAEGERAHFWKRLKKSLVTNKQKSTENVSLA